MKIGLLSQWKLQADNFLILLNFVDFFLTILKFFTHFENFDSFDSFWRFNIWTNCKDNHRPNHRTYVLVIRSSEELWNIIDCNTRETSWIEQIKKTIYYTNENHSSIQGHIIGLENMSQIKSWQRNLTVIDEEDNNSFSVTVLPSHA